MIGDSDHIVRTRRVYRAEQAVGPSKLGPYSLRRAVTGSMCIARRAGR